MMKVENGCVGCPQDIGCLGCTCPKYQETYWICDGCGDSTELYYFDDEELCKSCIIERLEKVEGSFY